MESLIKNLRKLFGNNDESLDHVLEVGSLFTNQLDKFALVGRLAVGLYSRNEFSADKIEFLTTTDKIDSAVNSILDHGYKMRSVTHDNNFYEVRLAKGESHVVVYAFSCLPDVMKDVKTSMIRNNEVAYNISLASAEDVFLVGLLYDSTYRVLMDKIDKGKLFKKYNKFPEGLREVMNKRFNLD